MKKQLLFIASLIVSLTTQAQCTISPSCTPSSTSGYCTQPIGGTQLPSAMVGSPYSTTIQVSVATIALDGAVQVFGVTINSATLPFGLGYSSNPSGGTISGGSSGCIEISGTPTTESMGYNVSFDVTAVTDQGNFNQTLNYTMNVDASTASLIENTGSSFTIYPNPSSSNVTLSLSTEEAQFSLVDLNGKELISKAVSNQETIDVSSFEKGIYIVKIDNATQRLVID